MSPASTPQCFHAALKPNEYITRRIYGQKRTPLIHARHLMEHRHERLRRVIITSSVRSPNTPHRTCWKSSKPPITKKQWGAYRRIPRAACTSIRCTTAIAIFHWIFRWLWVPKSQKICLLAQALTNEKR
ncbi:hypothetical protein JB92DRAFT_2833854 [Gautieria morchelliformis]|nr:hypothetical protein JB92DRAFT_2833854 [Gautieria morchelliformis]